MKAPGKCKECGIFLHLLIINYRIIGFVMDPFSKNDNILKHLEYNPLCKENRKLIKKNPKLRKLVMKNLKCNDFRCCDFNWLRIKKIKIKPGIILNRTC